jgi:GNAT superfamily N-acetyltransferase
MADAPADLEIRLLRADDDPGPQLDLAERAFGAVPAAERDGRLRSLPGQMASGRILGVFAGRQPAASASYHDMRQWWYGRQVPMAGVAGVMVAPEYRSRGVGRRVMTALLDEIAARGFPLSALYPATMPLYRSLGWELAGARDTVVIPARSLRTLAPPDDLAPAAAPDPRPGPELRRAGPGDADAVIAMLGLVHEPPATAARSPGARPWWRSGCPARTSTPISPATASWPASGTTTIVTCSCSAPRRYRRRLSGRSGRTSARTPR